MNSIQIGNRKIGSGFEPFIIAEMSGNHNQSLERALKIVEAAAETGVHAIKLQTYTADTLTIDVNTGAFFIKDSKSLWKGQSLYKLYQQAYTPWEWHKPILKLCRKLGLIFFSTPFDESAVDFLESLEVPCYKIASFENNHLPLIRKAASTKKPLIMSTGMATVAELDEAVKTARDAGAKDIILLKCTSTYPAVPEDSNLTTIPHLKKLFNVEVGLSDHTSGIGVSIASVALGAVMIEKHFTLSRLDGGVDSAFSMEPEEMKALVIETKRAWQSLGKISYEPSKQEKASMQYRRSLYVAEDLKKGEILTSKNLRAIRPGYGLPTKYYNLLIGRRINQAVKKGTPMEWDFVLNK